MLNTTPTATNGTKKGKYLALTLSDKTGQVAAKVWDDGPALAETIKPGVVVKVAADAREYNGRLELTVNKIRPANPDEQALADFLPSTDGDIEMMLKVVNTAIMQIINRDLYALVRSFYGLPAFKQAFSSAPATRRVHHAYLGGLLEQTVEMLQLADTLLTYYPRLNPDLLRVGVLLGNIGRARAFETKCSIEHSDEGELLGSV
ncbi:MAG: OB-fold nucleic acid binding domain-containing protein, partial [Chloroflexota bacterium]